MACFKVLPGKAGEFQDFLTGDARKLAQASVGQGRLIGWTASRGIIPRGEDADCDFTTARLYNGMPSSLQLVSDEALAKTGMKRSDLAAKVTSAARLASLRLWRVVDTFGQQLSEGDYYTVDLMAAPMISPPSTIQTAPEWNPESAISGGMPMMATVQMKTMIAAR